MYVGIAIVTPAVLAILFWPPHALAGSDSNLAFGLGTSLGFNHVNATENEVTFSGEVNMKLRIFKVIAVEVAYGPTDVIAIDSELIQDSRLKVSIAMHLVPTTPVGGYLKAGLGSADPVKMVDITNATNSYHVGGGLDWHIGEHFVVGAEFLWQLRGYNAWAPNLEELPDLTAGKTVTTPQGDSATVIKVFSFDDVVAGSTYRMVLAARWYF